VSAGESSKSTAVWGPWGDVGRQPIAIRRSTATSSFRRSGGRVSVAGPLAGILYQLIGGTKAGMTYCGAESIADLRVKARFVQVTHSGQIESHPHRHRARPLRANYP